MTSNLIVHLLALVVYAGFLGWLFPKVVSALEHRLHHREHGAVSWAVALVAVAVIGSITILVDHNRDIPPAYTIIISTVSSWVGAGAPTPRKKKPPT